MNVKMRCKIKIFILTEFPWIGRFQASSNQMIVICWEIHTSGKLFFAQCQGASQFSTIDQNIRRQWDIACTKSRPSRRVRYRSRRKFLRIDLIFQGRKRILADLRNRIRSFAHIQQISNIFSRTEFTSL